MTHWKETRDILARLAASTAARRNAALATVVRISGSAYRRPGAKFFVEDDGRTLGGVSGGCLEADVREIALDVVRSGVPRLLHYETGGDGERTVFGLGLGCDGAIDVFVQAAAAPVLAPAFAEARRCLDAHTAFAIATVVDGPDAGRSIVIRAQGPVEHRTADRLERAAEPALAAGVSRLVDVGPDLVFVEVLRPPPRLVIVGAGDDARPLAAYASDAGFAVTVVDHRRAFLTAERFPAARRLLTLRPSDDPAPLEIGPDTAAVMMTHSLAIDRGWLLRFLDTAAWYIGLLGPRARAGNLLDQLGRPSSARVFAPVGLDLGAEGPEQIAVSIVAELLAVRAGREPAHLRQRGEAIHAG